MIDFTPDTKLQSIKDQVRGFVETFVIPREAELTHDLGKLEALRTELQVEAKREGLFLPQLPEKLGGMGLDWRQTAVVFEEAGRSLYGPQALNAAAPDEGNMHLLYHAATDEQQKRYLEPLAAGEIRSCFAMTEPAPGAGSDPSLLSATAERKDGRWEINGNKWFITGAEGAAFSIVLVQTSEGPTMFLVNTDNPGFHLRRTVPTMDTLTPGGHGQIDLVDCAVDDGAVLGEVGKGFEYAQIRLDPARLTHCMRWLGIAVRSMEIATGYALRRESFGSKLSEHQAVQWMVADSHMEMHAARLMIWHAAWKLDMGERVRQETSMTKVFVAETVGRVVDRALQICGSLGVSEDIPLSHFYREVRPFRIYDGPSEVHRSSVARRVFRRVAEHA
ncbi:MAG TPA: acyl-CoA dehydrogenase family protein [Rubrobacteraceae bacterium]|nr:acyl-CoA dehydrogenase family protein [Rubrobacteraceae bacterium]